MSREGANPNDLATRLSTRVLLVHVTDLRGARQWATSGLRAGSVSRSPVAREVEALLGNKMCLYFYVGRVFPRRGGVALAVAVEADHGRDGWAAPFDTGGMLERIHFSSPRDRGSREEFLRQRAQIPLNEWRAHFSEFLAQYFDPRASFSSYWLDRPNRNDPDGMFECPDNEWRAWTFEIRYEFHDSTPPVTVPDVVRWAPSMSVVKALQRHFHEDFSGDIGRISRLFDRALNRAGHADYRAEMEDWVRTEAA